MGVEGGILREGVWVSGEGRGEGDDFLKSRSFVEVMIAVGFCDRCGDQKGSRYNTSDQCCNLTTRWITMLHDHEQPVACDGQLLANMGMEAQG